MVTGTLKTTQDGARVLEVDYHAARKTLVGSTGTLSDVEGVAVETAQGVFRITRVGRDFRAGNSRKVYLYVEASERADDVSAIVAARQQKRADERFEARKAPAPRLGDDAPTGWYRR